MPEPRAAFSIFVTAETPPPAELARMAEAHGAEALLFPDHTHIPVAAPRGHPGGAEELPPEYARLYDPLIAATAAAAATTTLRVGTAVCLLNQRDAIVTAKQVATLDRLSEGRVLLGVGAGWHEVEMANHGVDPSRRHLALRERVEAITAIWTLDQASYDGVTLRFGPLQSWPKPWTRPRPPILLGGNGPRAPERALAWADGWMPHTEVGGDAPLLARLADVRSRGRPGFDLTVAMAPADTARLDAYARAGAGRFLFQLPSAGRDAIEAKLERAARAMAGLLGTP